MEFFNKKDYSTSQLSFFSVIISSIAILICCFLLEISLINTLLILLIASILNYFVVKTILEKYIAKKIKLIYKLINQTKSSKREQYFNEHLLPQKTIEEVKFDVEKWALEKKDEIELLRKNEQFRKEFLMNLTHEVRTPIFNIQGYIDTLLNGALEDPQVNRKFLQNAANSVERLVHLVNDLHEISKLESGSIPLVIEHFHLQEIVQDVFEEIRLKAKEKNIQFEIKSDSKADVIVDGDKNKYKQVLTNLIENAIKYGSENGNVNLGWYALDKKTILVEVTDNGPGISEEHLPRIFERFYRADKSRNRSIGGTGLGLAIVKHIIEAHGQNVTVRSKIGIGTTFGFTIAKK
jgi:two-component system phosphate regulon sensor histidine kinase PhoR